MAKQLTQDQAIIISAFTGVLCCNFSELHDSVEKRLKRQVWTHEFPSIREEIKEAFREDFMEMCTDNKED